MTGGLYVVSMWSLCGPYVRCSRRQRRSWASATCAWWSALAVSCTQRPCSLQRYTTHYTLHTAHYTLHITYCTMLNPHCGSTMQAHRTLRLLGEECQWLSSTWRPPRQHRGWAAEVSSSRFSTLFPPLAFPSLLTTDSNIMFQV